MKKWIMLIALLLIPASAKAEVGTCYSTSGALEVACDTSGQQYVNVATGTLNVVNTITNPVTIADEVLTTYEYDFATVAITATATLSASATSTIAMICNAGGGTVFTRHDGTDAADDSGSPLFANACDIIEGAALTDIRFYNDHTGTVSVYVRWRR